MLSLFCHWWKGARDSGGARDAGRARNAGRAKDAGRTRDARRARDAGRSNNMQASTSSSNQFQSPLFRLPAEVRLVIWEYALSGEFIHIEHNPTMHCHEPTPPDSPVEEAQLHREQRLACGKTWAQKASLTRLNWHFTSVVCGKDAELPDGQVMSKGAMLGLLLSCKRIYQEAFDFLYPGNIFDFRSPRDFICFIGSLPASVKDTIRFVHIRVDVDLGRPPRNVTEWVALPPPNWDAACTALQQMPDLERLQLAITSPPERNLGPEQMERARRVEGLFQQLAGPRLQGEMRLLMFFVGDERLNRVLLERDDSFTRTEGFWQDCDVVFASEAG